MKFLPRWGSGRFWLFVGLLWLTCFIAGCAFSDSMGITTKRQTGTELVKVPVDADNDGVQDKDPKTGEPLFSTGEVYVE